MILRNLLISIILKKILVNVKKNLFLKIKKFWEDEKESKESEGKQREMKRNEKKRRETKGNEKKRKGTKGNEKK